MLMRAATIVQVLQDLFYVLLQLLVVVAIVLSFKFHCMFYCMFYGSPSGSLLKVHHVHGTPTVRDGNESVGHGSNGSPFLDGSRGSAGHTAS